MRDPYEVLGVDRDANDAEIRSAFRKGAARHHPDRNQGDGEAHERFTELNQAYQILSDRQKRAAYDRYGASAFARGGSPQPVEVDFANLDGIFGDILGAIGIKTGERGDIKKRVKVEFAEAALGCERELTFERVDLCEGCEGSGAAEGAKVATCPSCHGKGRVRVKQGFIPIPVERGCTRCRGIGSIPERYCPKCKGVGLGKREVTVEVSIPAGIESGMSRVVDKMGSRVRRDRPPGDLEVVVDVRPHELFRRAGDDIVCDVPISFTQAALGGQVTIPTLDGKVKLKVPPATQPGSILRVRGKGVPHRLKPGRGDQLVEIHVEIPTQLSDRARDLIEELGEALGEDVQPQQHGFMQRLRNLFGGGE